MDRAVLDRHIAELRSVAEEGDVPRFARALSDLLLVLADLIDAGADPHAMAGIVLTITEILQRFHQRNVH